MRGHSVVDEYIVLFPIGEEVHAVCAEGIGLFGLDDLFHDRLAGLFPAQEVAHACQVAVFDVQLNEAGDIWLHISRIYSGLHGFEVEKD
jgi:hypothetical protein